MDIKGIGIDLIEIDRIKKMKFLERFMLRVFSENERAYYKIKGSAANTVAGNFASKEAVLKALGTGLRGMELKEIEVLRDESGKPYIVMNGKALDKARELGIKDILITISHSENYAIAQAIAVGDSI